MRSDFDLLSEASGKKDAEFARDIYKEFLAAKREELLALRDAAATGAIPGSITAKVSYAKPKSGAKQKKAAAPIKPSRAVLKKFEKKKADKSPEPGAGSTDAAAQG